VRGLKRPAVPHAGAGLGHALGGFHDLLFALHRAGAGHHDELVAADIQAVDDDRVVSLLNSRLTNL